MSKVENKAFLTEQIITYIGNKRALLAYIETELVKICNALQRDKLVCVDLFSGSGIVARLMKKYSSHIFANDLEPYSAIINRCYLTNKENFPEEDFARYFAQLQIALQNPKHGLISEHYSPSDDQNIKSGERVFYTSENARIIDTVRSEITDFPTHVQDFFLAPLLYEASVHNNTGGVFKGFYKDSSTGIGKYGGNGQHALTRILGKIQPQKPVLSNFSCDFTVLSNEANALAPSLPHSDVVYIDPPYNQHPYGSNYFMLNVIAQNAITAPISAVSGIPEDWNRSDYNKAGKARAAFERLLHSLDSKFIIISYNNEGFIAYEDMKEMAQQVGRVSVKDINYNAYRGSRNLSARSIYVNEYIFVIDRR